MKDNLTSNERVQKLISEGLKDARVKGCTDANTYCAVYLAQKLEKMERELLKYRPAYSARECEDVGIWVYDNEYYAQDVINDLKIDDVAELCKLGATKLGNYIIGKMMDCREENGFNEPVLEENLGDW